nr:MAG TPA: hypothetical protein [Caudoviricetes sp.]DAN19736.1 MAG TPA: hypothetical protein [Caudoviricetes sp.]
MHHNWQMLFLSRASITTTNTLKIKEDSMNPLISISTC